MVTTIKYRSLDFIKHKVQSCEFIDLANDSRMTENSNSVDPQNPEIFFSNVYKK